MAKIRLKDLIEPTHIVSDSPKQGKIYTNDRVFIAGKSLATKYNLDKTKTKPSDFAILNGVMLEDFETENAKSDRGCVHWLRDFTLDEQTGVDYVIQVCHWNNGIMTNGVVNNYVGIKPLINISVERFLKCKEKFEIKVNDNNTASILLGEFPQTFVGQERNEQLESIFSCGVVDSYKTGKKYLCRFDKYGEPIFAEEYFNENSKKIVRLKNNADDYDHTAFNDGTLITLDEGDPAWVNVEPIKWNILNFDKLPKEINPNGTGEDDVIRLISEYALNAMPFYKGDYFDNFNYLWQNSTIRGYLNGINVSDIKTNGNPNFEAPNGGNFAQGPNFLDEAFNKTIEYTGTLSNGDNMKKSNPYNFNFSELSNDELLEYYIQSNSAVFLHGPSGVGKSARVKQIDPTATRITLRPQMNPEEIDGTLDRQTGDYIPPLWWTDLCKKCKDEPNRIHVLFIDELTNVKPTVQSLIYSIVLDRAGKDGLWPLPENSVVIAAGNENADNLAAYPITNALFRRFCHIYYKVDKEDWLCWATDITRQKTKPLVSNRSYEKQSKIHPAIIAYIMSRGESVLNQSLDEENPKIVTDPRKWEIASKVLYQTGNPNALIPAIGEELTADFAGFVQSITLSVEHVIKHSYDKLYVNNIDLSNKIANLIPLTFAKENELAKVRGFVKTYFGNELLTNFDLLWIKNNPERALILSEKGIEDAEFIAEKNKIKRNKTVNEISATNSSLKSNSNSNAPVLNNFKMSIDDFVDCKEIWTYAIRTKTLEQALLLNYALNKSNKFARNFTADALFDFKKYEKDSCYVNNGYLLSIAECNDYNIKILNFEDVDLSKKLDKEDLEKWHKIIDKKTYNQVSGGTNANLDDENDHASVVSTKTDKVDTNSKTTTNPFSWLKAVYPQKNKKPVHAISIDEFLDMYDVNRNPIAIKCASIEEAKLLCKVFNIIGKKTVHGENYDPKKIDYTLTTNCYGNDGNLGSDTSYVANIDFCNVDFTKYVSQKEVNKAIKKGEKNNAKIQEFNA